MKPHNHQTDCLKAIQSERKQGKKEALVVMATASGKTATAGFDFKEFINDFPEAKMLYLCHKNDILYQAKDTFKLILEKGESSFGFLNGVEKNLRAQYLFASFQTMKENLDKFNSNDFDYIIVDESHHAVADTYQPVVEYFNYKFKLGMTATPDRLDMRDMKKLFGGKETFSLPLEEALVLGLLAKIDYRLITDEIIDLGEIKNPFKLSVKELNRNIFVPKRDSEIVEIISEKTKSVVNPKMIIFCSSVEHVERMSELIPNSKPVHHGFSDKKQKDIVQDFRDGKITTILTIDKFNEGTDIPEVNIVVFLRSTSSPNIFYHQLGRGLRNISGKKSVLVLDFVANCERVEMIQELSERIESAKKKYLTSNLEREKKEKEIIALDFGGFEFTEKAQSIISIIKNIRQGYTKESLINQLQTLNKMLGRTPTVGDIYQASKDGWMASDHVFRRVFKNLNNARRAAGLTINREAKYDEQTLISQYKWLAKTLGRTPVTSDIDEYADKGVIASFDCFVRTFKGLEAVRKIAGIEAPQGDFNFSKEQLLIKYKALAKKLDKSPTARDISDASRNGEMSSFRVYRRVFKNMNNLRKQSEEVMIQKDTVKIEASNKLNISVKNKLKFPLVEFDLENLKKNMLLSLWNLWSYLKRKPDISDVNVAAREGKISIPNYEAYKVIFGGLDIALELLDEK